MSAIRLVKASRLPPAFPGQGSVLKSKPLKTSLHRICRSVSSFIIVTLTRFLWSVRTLKSGPLPLRYRLHSLSARTMANSSLSCKSWLHSAGAIVFDRYAISLHFPSSSRGDSMPEQTYFEASVSTRSGLPGSKFVNTGVEHSFCRNCSNAACSFSPHSHLTSFLVLSYKGLAVLLNPSIYRR